MDLQILEVQSDSSLKEITPKLFKNKRAAQKWVGEHGEEGKTYRVVETIDILWVKTELVPTRKLMIAHPLEEPDTLEALGAQVFNSMPILES